MTSTMLHVDSAGGSSAKLLHSGTATTTEHHKELQVTEQRSDLGGRSHAFHKDGVNFLIS